MSSFRMDRIGACLRSTPGSCVQHDVSRSSRRSGARPGRWPRDAVGAVSTHDLPTVAGIWNLTEPDLRLHRLRRRLLDVTRAPEGRSAFEVAIAAYRVLARARSRIVLAQLEDAIGVEERPNVPGTTTEFPNWRLALPLSLEVIERSAGTRRIASVMRRAGRNLTPTL